MGKPVWMLVALLLACRGESPDTVTESMKQGQIVDSVSYNPRDTPDGAYENVTGIAVSPAGDVAVSDGGENRIYLFDRAGTRPRVIGRKGSGPGEFVNPCCLAMSPRGQLWVEDIGNQRYSVFRLTDSTPTVAFTLRMPSQASGRWDRVTWTPDGRLVHLTSVVDPRSGMVGLRRSLVDSAGSESEIAEIAEPPMESLSVVTVSSGKGQNSGSATYAEPYGATSLHAFGPGGVEAHAVSSRYAVRLHRAEGGDTVIGRSVVPPVVSERERKEAEDLLDQIGKRLSLSRSQLGLHVPARKPPLCNLGFDLEGRLWVELCREDGRPRVADLYSVDGASVETRTWPRSVRLSLFAIRANEAYGTQTDSLGNQRVVKLSFSVEKE